MKKWKRSLLISTLVLGSVPYNAVISPNHASAAEVEDQAVENSVVTQPDSALKSNNNTKEIQTETSVSEIASGSEASQVVRANTAQDNVELTNDSSDNTKKEPNALSITPRRTKDFLVTVNGVVQQVKPEYNYTNVSTLKFEREDPDDEFVKSYQHAIEFNNEFLLANTVGNTIDFNSYIDYQASDYFAKEGIYMVAMLGFSNSGFPDTGFFYNNFQRTTSSVEIKGDVVDENGVVKDPVSIEVGRDKNDTYGDYSFSWVISGTDLAGNAIEIKGNDRQPTAAELASLPPGIYIITNTVNETVPDGFAPAEITDTTSSSFKLTGGSVIVEHILLDKDKNETLYKTEDPEYGRLNTNYTTNPIEIKGYKLVEEKKPENQNGKYTESEQLVKYYYEKIKTNVTVKYLDEQGNPISEEKIIPGEYGENYTSEPTDIHGYDLVTTPDNASGNYTDQDQTVTYVYKKKATKLNVHFVDEKGKPLADDLVQNGLFNDPYSTEPASIPGYILVEIPSNASGKHSVDPTEVTYVYKKIEAPTVTDTLEGSKTVSGKGTPNSQVVVTFPNGSTLTVDVDKNGNWQVNVPKDIVLKKGETIIAVTLDPKTGVTSDPGKGKVLPLVPKLLNTGTDKSKEKIVDPNDPSNTSIKEKVTSSVPLTSSANTTKSASGKRLPNTGEEANCYAVKLGFLALIVTFFGKMLKKREAE